MRAKRSRHDALEPETAGSAGGADRPPHVAAALSLQRKAGNRVLARRLKATAASEGDWQRFLALAQPAAGLRFTRNKAGVVSTAPWTPPKPAAAKPTGPTRLAPGQAPSLSAPRLSPTFRDRLQAIVADRKQDAEIHVGSGQSNVLFGGFPKGGAPDKVQRIDIDDIEMVERWTPGHGVAKLLHEIVENHIGHAPAGQPGGGFGYDDAHAAATGIEADVVRDGVGAASARGGVASMPDPASRSTTIYAFDYVDHFLVVDVAPDGSIMRSRTAAAMEVKRVTVGDFEAGQDFLDHTTSPNLKAFAAFIGAWAGTNLGTVRIAGQMDASDAAAGGSQDLRLKRATAALKGINRVFPGARFKPSEVAITASATAGRCAEIAVVAPDIPELRQ